MGKNRRTLIDYIYPPRCPICDDILEGRKNFPCVKCYHKISYIKSPRCMKCGKQLDDEYKEYCFDCVKKRHYYTRGIAVWSYQDSIKQSIYNFKYNNRRDNSKFYANEIIRIYGRMIKSWDVDVIIPIPIHKKRKQKRGFNQAELIAREISNITKIPLATDILVRNVNTKPQKELNDIERIKNLRDAFSVNPTTQNIKKALLIDDIYTTGATIDMCSKLLRESGFREIYYVCVCTGKGF